MGGHPAVIEAHETATGIRLTLNDPKAVSAITGGLIESGVTVAGFAAIKVSLEDRFLKLTSRVGDRS